MSTPNIVFAGDRDIAVAVLDFLIEDNANIKALLLPNEKIASHADTLRDRCEFLEENRVLRGETFREEKGRQILRNIDPDYIIAVHFSYIVPSEILEIPAHGVVNLHPAYLPYNRGWHTPSWAIWDQTPYGATLHFMEEDVDAGDIINRREVEIRPEDTADSLYRRVKTVEYELFQDTWPELAAFEYETVPQPEDQVTAHKRDDLEAIRKIHLNEKVTVETLLRKLRALTTNRIDEAAYFVENGNRYRVQVNVVPEQVSPDE